MRVLTEANIEFRSVALSGGSFVMVVADGRIRVWDSLYASTWRASVDGEVIGRRYRSELGAIRAAIKHMKRRGHV